MNNSRPRAFDTRLLDQLTSVVSAAGAALLAARSKGLDARLKADRSPVTLADQASEAVLLEGLAHVLPGIPVISEEAGCPLARLPACFALVDPLDGTRELLAGRDEFTINLAIVEDGRPRLGIIAAPAQGTLWRGIEGSGAERLFLAAGAKMNAVRQRTAIAARACPPAGIVAAISRSHLDAQTQALLARLPVARTITCGSALKFCRLAEGAADVYPRLSVTCEWDVAAGHAIVAAAGGTVIAASGDALSYGGIENEFRISAFVAWGDPSAPAALGLGRRAG
jgi:3'(2'), 5'-bisphosphate nucleotidase